MNLGHESEQLEIEIEKALLNLQQGEVAQEKVQEIMNNSLNTKYKVQVALTEYKQSVKELNEAQDKITNDYKPILQQIQQYEESRINFSKYNFEKFVKHLNELGKRVQDNSADCQKKIQVSNSEIELNKFIEMHLTSEDFPSKPVEYEPFKLSDDLKRYKEFLAE